MDTITRRRILRLAAAAGLSPFASAGVTVAREDGAALRGFNLIETPEAPFGSQAARDSLDALKAVGADTVAIVPFFWQAGPNDPNLVFGDALPADRLRRGIVQAKEAGLHVVAKPHVWVPQTWAGAVEMKNDADWSTWFVGYRAALNAVALAAAEGGADALSIGTELQLATHRPEWPSLIEDVRTRFDGTLTYVAHGADEAAQIGFWSLLDALAVSLYPEMGETPDRWRAAVDATLTECVSVAKAKGRPLWVAEIGLRSAKGAAPRPWESAEERQAPVDEAVQADVLDLWLSAIARHPVACTLIWRWFTDPAAGGSGDTDFTVQGKRAERVIAEHWRDGA